MRRATVSANPWTAGVAAVGLSSVVLTGLSIPSRAQPAPQGPVAVGVVQATLRPITQTNEYLGRIAAINHVDVVARVTAFLDKRLYQEGTEVKKGTQLYQLERGPFEADLAAKQATVAQLQATLENAKLTTGRARTLLGGPAGQQSTYDAAVASEKSLDAQVQSAQAQVQASQINLDYTNITSPIDGKIGRTAVTDGNVVSPSSGVLTTIVSQDPMYITFPVSVRESLDLRDRYATRGGFNAVVIRIRLPDGRLYGQTGKLDFVNNTIATNTDTITLRGEIANPPLYETKDTSEPVRELTDGEFVTVLLEGVQPVQVLAIPRSAVLSDQQGDYVYVVGADNKAEQRRINLGQSTTTIAAVIGGLKAGDSVIVDGLQRLHPGQAVSPGPASPQLQSAMSNSANAEGSGKTAPGAASTGAAPPRPGNPKAEP